MSIFIHSEIEIILKYFFVATGLNMDKLNTFFWQYLFQEFIYANIYREFRSNNKNFFVIKIN